jgi:outer membrane lipoprotein LolB
MRTGFWFALLLLTACASRPPLMVTYPGQWPAHAQAALDWQDWELQGRVALRMDDEGWHGGLHWTQRADAYAIRISGPFGQGGVQLEGEAGRVRLQQGERVSRAADAEALMRQELGWSLPLAGLDHWVRGVPRHPDQARLAFDAQGRLARIEEAGWVVDYQGYDEGTAPPLPTRISLEQAGLRLRLVVDQWRRLAPTGAADD